MNKTLIICLIFFAFCTLTTAVNAQKKQSAKEVVNGFSQFLDSEQTATPGKTESISSVPNTISPPRNAMYDSLRFFRELKQADFAAYQQQRSFAWQYYSSICIFIVVMFIVIMGLVLSFKQFQLTEKQVTANITKPKEETITVENTNANFEISQTGLKINTGVIGLAILFMSLAFFFLYLKYVYGISVVDTGN